MPNRILARVLVLVLAAALPGCGETERAEAPRAADTTTEAASAEPALRSELLVEGDWVAENLGDPELVVLHVGADEAEYRRSHIPGARFIPVSALNREREGRPNMLPEPEELARTFEAAGVSRDSRVVVYGAPLAAARAFVALEHLGHERVSLLNGGLGAWGNGSRVEAGEPRRRTPDAQGRLGTATRGEVVVDAGWVAERLSEPSVALIDARPPRQYTGEEAGERVPRPGHIPGASNLFWEELVVSPDEPRLKDEATLRALFRENGAAPGGTVVTYCRTGMQASFAYFVSRYLGYETRMYDGSFVDWSPREELPVERGSGRG